MRFEAISSESMRLQLGLEAQCEFKAEHPGPESDQRRQIGH
jgi:hypothetical protein